MDISRAHARVTSSRAHRRLGDEPRARIDPTPPPDPDSDPDSDLLGIELDEWDLSPLDGERPTHSPPPTGWEDAQQPRLPAQVRRMAAASRKRSKPRPLSGYLATLFYVGKEIQREKDAERVRIAKAMPKAIEAALTAQRERMKRRKRVQAVCPNPVRGVRTFLANPVTRFWLGCNLCCTAFLFLVSRLSEEPHTPTRRASVRLSRPAVCVPTELLCLHGYALPSDAAAHLQVLVKRLPRLGRRRSSSVEPYGGTADGVDSALERLSTVGAPSTPPQPRPRRRRCSRAIVAAAAPLPRALAAALVCNMYVSV